MAEQHWIKYYRIDPKNIRDDGTIDDNALLYPFYGHLHPSKTVERFNEPIEYDQASNTDHGFTEGLPLYDLRENKMYKTGLKRGFSVNGYIKGADNMLWTPAGDDSGYLISGTPANVDEAGMSIPRTDKVDDYKDDLQSTLKKIYNNDLNSYRNGLVALPTIVTADEDDLVRYADYKYNGYNPNRDSVNEQMLKKIKYRRLPKGLKFEKAVDKLKASSIETAKDFLKNTRTYLTDYKNGLITRDELLYQIGAFQYGISDSIEDYFPGIKNMFKDLEQAIRSDDTEQVEQQVDKIANIIDTVDNNDNTVWRATGDPEQWFPKNIISSDERLKDIEGSADSDWIDFGNNHKKHIYDDFMKWYDNSCTQRDIANCLGDRL